MSQKFFIYNYSVGPVLGPQLMSRQATVMGPSETTDVGPTWLILLASARSQILATLV